MDSTQSRPTSSDILRPFVIGASVLGLVGGVVGLVLGLIAYPPTAWFAVLEIGVPAAMLGGALGLLFGWVGTLARRPR